MEGEPTSSCGCGLQEFFPHPLAPIRFRLFNPPINQPSFGLRKANRPNNYAWVGRLWTPSASLFHSFEATIEKLTDWSFLEFRTTVLLPKTRTLFAPSHSVGFASTGVPDALQNACHIGLVMNVTTSSSLRFLGVAFITWPINARIISLSEGRLFFLCLNEFIRKCRVREPK